MIPLKHPCYRLDKETLERIEIVETVDPSPEFQIIDPDFEYLYMDCDSDTLNTFGNKQKKEM